ncbi:hypothetical protein ADLECEL_12740 [Adlercreutzia equolifaciens subsp. celatus]|nr:hypothetical protein ADLECEL_12740 [Adlercreutzia equolifaciens subsp. celatus]
MRKEKAHMKSIEEVESPSIEYIAMEAGSPSKRMRIKLVDKYSYSATSYWSARDCGGDVEPRPSGYKSNAFCACGTAR